MMKTRILWENGTYLLEKRTYNADISATGNEITMYEVTDTTLQIFEAFTTLNEAKKYMKDMLLVELPPVLA